MPDRLHFRFSVPRFGCCPATDFFLSLPAGSNGTEGLLCESLVSWVGAKGKHGVEQTLEDDGDRRAWAEWVVLSYGTLAVLCTASLAALDAERQAQEATHA